MHHNILSQYYLTTKTMFKMTIVTRGQGQADEPTDRQTEGPTIRPTDIAT